MRFKNQGLDSIEVQDNGSGISQQNYETLALKHYTSKLSTYADLTTLQTFGFRGEALSSLCALSNFSVVTCTQEEAPKANKLQFESFGKLTSTSVVSGQRGTTVFVENLFHNLPVRRRELERNIKREWGKVVNLLNQYACVLTGVKFSVSQQPTKGKRMVLFSTKGNLTTRDNIINVFGVKTMNALITLELKLDLTPTITLLQKQSLHDDENTKEILVRGHVSRPAHGEGRQTPDRQMFYVNGRPCGLPQFAKVFNEVYRSYNVSQSPFIFADIQLDTHLYDVNVSPDKRTILLHDQGQMLDNLKESLIELFEKQDVTVPVGQLSTNKQTPLRKLAVPRSETPVSGKGSIKRGSTAYSSPSIPNDANSGADRPDNSEDDGDEEEEGEEREEEGEDGEEEEEEGIDSDDENGGGRQFKAKGRKGTSDSPRSISRVTRGSSLITRWVERKTNVREVTRPAGRTLDGGMDSDGAAKGKERAISKSDKDDDSTASSPEESGVGEEDDTDIPKRNAAIIGNYSAQPGSQCDLAGKPTTEGPDTTRDSPDNERHESPIPAIPPPTQSRPNPTPATRSPRRPVQQVATIRIGDDTVTSVLGPPAAKRLRTSAVPETSTPKPKKADVKPSAPLPSFGGRLTQMFAAQGSSQSPDVDHPEPVTGEESDQDESLFVSQGEDQHGNDGEATADNHEIDRPGSDEEADSDVEHEQERSEGIDDESIEETAGHVDMPSPASGDDNEEYVEEEQGSQEAQESQEAQGGLSVQELLAAAEGAASNTKEDTQKRSQMLLKGGSRRKDSTLQLMQRLKVDEGRIRGQMQEWNSRRLAGFSSKVAGEDESDDLEADDAEEKLSLKISKSDFGKMKILGQFNLGFILAVREAEEPAEGGEGGESESPQDDELFIIDQHASDEKYNFERLQASTVVQSQRLVQPKTLELTAIEEEVIMENISSLETNGFNVKVDESGDTPVGSRVQLLSLPLSRETTFSLADLEELIFLLADNPTSSATTVPRPSKVRKMFAMRACRSSIMVGKALSHRQMEKVVRHMGEMEKPWNCPHGRPTMRHLCGLGAWEGRAWSEGDGFDGRGLQTDWPGWVKGKSKPS